jgi:hypothetical protein
MKFVSDPDRGVGVFESDCQASAALKIRTSGDGDDEYERDPSHASQ